MTGFIIALISGALMSIQGVLNTGVTKQTSIWVSAGWVQLTAFITCRWNRSTCFWAELSAPLSHIP